MFASVPCVGTADGTRSWRLLGLALLAGEGRGPSVGGGGIDQRPLATVFSIASRVTPPSLLFSFRSGNKSAVL